jgi:hypothetical protein
MKGLHPGLLLELNHAVNLRQAQTFLEGEP